MKLSSHARVGLLAVLLFLSGGSALIYQMVWLREFRLVFGGATPATAAVLAVFMGGLGVGSVWFGRRAERTADLLRLYAVVELSLSVAAVATPWLLRLVRAGYIHTGGVVALGAAVAIPLQILMAVVVLAGPCFLMGGTLPLAVKWAEIDEDGQRGATGLLYGLNALGALAGVCASTFFLLEALGVRGTLYLGAGLNAAIGAVALGISLKAPPDRAVAPALVSRRKATVLPAAVPPAAPTGYVLGAAFVTGFVFFLTELVWYRMSAPLLGSSTYSYGIILALVLVGIGLGGLAYRAWVAPRAGASSLATLGLVTAIQAFGFVLPYALGDRIAVVAFHANQLRGFGFGGQVAGWSLIGALLVLLPSVLAGVQFPLLVSLLGRGRASAGEQTGYAYAANTVGAIAGSLLGGFVLLPAVTAPGCWRLAVWLTLALSAAASVLGFRDARPWIKVATVMVGGLTLWLSLAALGPSGAWRHTPIGYGRVEKLPTSPNELQDWMNSRRREVRHEFEGRESSVAIKSDDGYAFYVNGKSDGSALGDAPTQTMGGLVGALLHPHPRTACVVGLGTGSSAGWLADVPGMERVDVVEIEPGMRDLARDYFAPVNRDVMRKPNVRVIPGDAREVLLVQGPPYDLIFSEPSNPYRAGIASLYTREYYEAVRRRLGPDGIFSQWVQGYEIDARTVRLVYATLVAVFPYVETWITQPADLLFVCHLRPPDYTLDQLRKRVATAPFDEALRRTWVTDSAEGVLAHHIASPVIARGIAQQGAPANTDDNNLLEYGFARAIAQQPLFNVGDIISMASAGRAELPSHLRGQLDQARMAEELLLLQAAALSPIVVPPDLQGEAKGRAEAMAAYVAGDHAKVLQLWRGEPQGPLARLILLEAMSHAGQPEQARPLVEHVRVHWPVEARFAAAQLAARHGAAPAAVDHLKFAFTALRTEPWVRSRVVRDGLALAVELGKHSPAAAAELFGQLDQPFCLTVNDLPRVEAMVALSRGLSPELQVRAADAWGAWPPWTRAYLGFRRDAYVAAHDPRSGQAQADLDAFLAVSGRSFLETVFPTRPDGARSSPSVPGSR